MWGQGRDRLSTLGLWIDWGDRGGERDRPERKSVYVGVGHMRMLYMGFNSLVRQGFMRPLSTHYESYPQGQAAFSTEEPREGTAVAEVDP